MLSSRTESEKVKSQKDMPSQSPVRAPAHVLSLLDRLHTLSETQEPAFNTRFRELAALRASDPDAANHELDLLALDKFVALDRDKCEFVYQLILATGAKTVVEAGTSFGVSTMYLALAVGENSRNGKVIATEKEPDKAAKARTYWAEAGECVQRCIELREGDLLETLTRDLTEVDMLLLDSEFLFISDLL
jgi:predicted O-methyltransferase YrrM